MSLSTDGAAVMMGRKAGVGVQVKSKLAPYVIQSHCIAHKLNLAVSDSIKGSKLLIKFRNQFKKLYFHLNGSSNRKNKLTEMQAVLNYPE